MFNAQRPLQSLLGIVLMVGAALSEMHCGSPRAEWPDDADQSAARAVALSYAEALREGDKGSAFELAIEDQENRRCVETELATVASVKSFSEALAARFGREAGVPDRYFDPAMSSRRVDAVELSRAEVRIYHDRAIVCERGSEPGDENAIYELRRAGSRWKVWEVTPDVDILTEKMRAEIAEAARAYAMATRQFASDVTEGKYRSAQEAKTKLREFLLRISADAGLGQKDSRKN
jgi:hypothetical protein